MPSTATEQRAPSSDSVDGVVSQEGNFDWSLFSVLAALLVAIAVSNVWLRLRAERRTLADLLGAWRGRDRSRPGEDRPENG